MQAKGIHSYARSADHLINHQTRGRHNVLASSLDHFHSDVNTTRFTNFISPTDWFYMTEHAWCNMQHEQYSQVRDFGPPRLQSHGTRGKQESSRYKLRIKKKMGKITVKLKSVFSSAFRCPHIQYTPKPNQCVIMAAALTAVF